MEKKGFTLIELVAVITLLALIILVTVPVIINTLGNTEDKEYEDFKKLVTNAAELYVERNRDLYPELNEVGGKIYISANTLITEGYIKDDLENPVNNESITNYKIRVSVEQDKILNYEINKSNNFVDITTISKDYGIDKVNECASNGICNPGDAFAIKVNDTDIYKFYVISDDGNTVTLIMDRNIGSKIAWYEDNDDTTNNGKNNLGPITVLNYLNSQTLTWDNIELIEGYTYDNNLNGTKTYGYQKLLVTNGKGVLTSKDGTIETELEGTMRARILTDEEAYALVDNNGKIPAWLYGNLSGLNTAEKPFGYWLLTASWAYSNGGYAIGYDGITYEYSVSLGIDNGARPVIEISRY